MPRTKIQTIFKSQILTGMSDAPRLDIERILMHVLQRTEAAWLYAHGEEGLSAEQAEEFERLVAERATGKPLAYVLGEWEFYGRPFYVTEDVLVPRPSTEELVSAALPYIDLWREKHPGEQMTIADVGTGSGVIAITLALETPSPRSARALPLRKGEKGADETTARKRFSSPYEGEVADPANAGEDGGVKIIATDLSPTALAVANKNARRYGVENRIEFIQGSMLTPLRNKKIDLIVSNPPYIPSGELTPHFAKASRGKIATLGLNFEPRVALDGGEDGQRYIKHIAASGIPAIVEGMNGKILKFNI